MTVPTPTVLLDDGTGTFPFDITSKVLAADGYQITRGRDDWISAVTAGELTLTLNNSDGRFTPGSTILATPSPITVDQKILLKETVNGTAYTRHTGYVKSWPVAWPAVVTTFATVQLTATDAQARAERRPLRSMLEEEIVLTSPGFYYTLAEPQGSTSAGDTSGNAASLLTAAGSGTAFTMGTGTGPGVDGLTATQFFGGQYLAPSSPVTGTFASFGCWMNTTTAPPLGLTAVLMFNGASIVIDLGGHVEVVGNTLGILGGPVITDGKTHLVVVTFDGTTTRLYVDGSLFNSVAVGDANTSLLGIAGPTQLSPSVTSMFTGTLSHEFATSAVLNATQVASIYGAGTSLAESGTARLTRVASYVGTTVGTLDTSLTNVTSDALTGKSAQDAIQEVTDAEGGLAFIDGTGALVFHNRSRVWGKTSPDLTLDKQWVTPDVTPVLDDQRLLNYFETTSAGTGATTVIQDTTSQTKHGRYPQSQTYLVQTDQEATDRARWVVGTLATPTPRYGSLTINLFGMTASQASTVLAALELDCWLRVTNLASQNPDGATSDVIVESWSESVTAESWEITCNVVSRSLFVALVLDDPVYGSLDDYPLGY